MSAAGRAGFLYIVLAVAMTWPLAAHIAIELPAGGDNLYVAWSLAWIAHAAVQAPAEILHGNIFYPARYALAFSDSNLSSGLPLVPVYLATRNPALLVNVLLLASFVLCGVAAFVLVRDWGATERAAVAAGVFFAFSPLRFSHLDHLQLYSFWWTPLALLVFDRYLREGCRGQAWTTGLLVVLQIHASLYLALFQLTALTLLLAMSAATGRAKLPWRRFAVDLGLVGAAVLLVCAPLGLAYYSVNRTWGVTRSLAENVRYSASASAFLSAAPANVLWGSVLQGFADPVAPWEKYLFPGVVPVVLAVFGCWREPRAFLVRYGVLLLVLGAVFSLGPLWISSGSFGGMRLPYSFAYQWVLPLRGLRAPARWALLASLGLALSAAAGAARLPRATWTVAVVAAVAEAWVWPLPTEPAPPIAGPPRVYRFLARSGSDPVIELPLGADWQEQFRLEPERVYWSTLHWRPLANGYSGFTPPIYRELARLSAAGPSPELLRALAAWNLRTVILHLGEMNAHVRDGWQQRLARGDLREVFRDGDTSVVELLAAAEPSFRARASVEEGARVVAGRRQPLAVRFAAGDRPRPLPPADIGWHTGRARWRAEGGETTSGWVRYYCPPLLDPGRVSERMFVAPPARQGNYLLEVAGACFDLSAPLTVK